MVTLRLPRKSATLAGLCMLGASLSACSSQPGSLTLAQASLQPQQDPRIVYADVYRSLERGELNDSVYSWIAK